MKLFKRSFKCFLAFILVILIFWTAALGLLQTEQGQQWALNNVKGYVERKTGMRFEVGTVHFSFPLSLEFKNIELSRDSLPIATIDHLDICCAYTHLLNGRLVFSKIGMSGMRIHRLPEELEASGYPPETFLEAASIPFYIKLAHIDLQDIRLSQEAINSLAVSHAWNSIFASTSYDLQGMITNNPFRRSISALLQIKATNDNPLIPPLNIGISAQNQHLSLSCHLNPIPLQLLHANFPEGMTGNLSLFANANDVDWKWISQWKNHSEKLIDGHFKLTLAAPREGRMVIGLLIQDQTTLSSRYRLKSSGEIELIDFKAENPSLQIEGEALIHANGKTLQTKAKGLWKDLELLSSMLGQEIKGSLAFSAQGEGPLSSPNLHVNITTPQLQLFEHSFTNVQAAIQAQPDNSGINGKVDISFNHQNLPLKLGTDFDWKDLYSLSLTQLTIDGMNTSIKGDVACTLPEYLLEGQLTAETKKLDDFSLFLPSPISGEGQLNIRFAQIVNESDERLQKIDTACIFKNVNWGHMQARRLQLNMSFKSVQKDGEWGTLLSLLKGEDILWEGYSIEQCIFDAEHLVDHVEKTIKHTKGHWDAQGIRWEEGAIEQAEGIADLKSPLDNMEGSLQIALRNVKTHSLRLSELSWSTIIKSNALPSPFLLKGKGSWKEDLIFTAEGNWHQNDKELTLVTEQLNGSLGPYPLALKQPVVFHKQPDEIQLMGLNLQVGEGELQANFNQKQQSITAQFQTNAVPSELFYFVAPNLPLTGRTTIQGDLNGSLEKPEGHFEVDLHNVQIVEEIFVQKPLINGKVLMDLDETGISLHSELMGIGRTPLLVTGSIPLHIKLNPFRLNVDQSQPVNLLLNAEGELDPYLNLFFNDTKNLTGHAKIALTLSGQLQFPVIKGNIDLTDGSYESTNTGALYHHIEAHLEGDGSKIVLTQFSAQDNKSGSLKATGAVTIDPDNLFPFEFQIQPSHVNILDSDYASISASGPLSLIGNSKNFKLQGELAVENASVRLEEALPKQIKSVDITYVNLSEEGKQAQLEVQNHDSNLPLELDIKLLAEENVRIEGNHLKSEWKGALAVSGTPENIQLHGDLRVAKGDYNYNGKIFNLTQGTIHFGGAVDKKTTLYVVASHDLDRIRADIIIKGPAHKPEISFRSNPPLSQREVLSYILFNRGISDITPDQGDQLSQSFISLNSSEQKKGNGDFLTRLRNNMGIDRLDFTTNDKENKDLGLQVGKYITQNVIVSVNQSMTSLSPVIAVEAKLKKNFKVQAESGVAEDAPVRMSLKWKKDY